jgi:ribosome-associated translation inhibitor RaiA
LKIWEGYLFQYQFQKVMWLQPLFTRSEMGSSFWSGAILRMRRTAAKLFAKPSSQDLYAMMDDLKGKVDDLMRKSNGKSSVHRDHTVKHPAMNG